MAAVIRLQVDSSEECIQTLHSVALNVGFTPQAPRLIFAQLRLAQEMKAQVIWAVLATGNHAEQGWTCS